MQLISSPLKLNKVVMLAKTWKKNQIFIFIELAFIFCLNRTKRQIKVQGSSKLQTKLAYTQFQLLNPFYYALLYLLSKHSLRDPQRQIQNRAQRRHTIFVIYSFIFNMVWQIKYNFFAMTSYDQFLHKLNLIPPQADKILRDIRQLDRQVEEARLQLEPLRGSFLQKLANPQQRKSAKSKHELEQHYKSITKFQNQIELKALQKITLAERLYNLIHQPTQKLQKELHQRGIDKGDEDSIRRKRGKKAIRKPMKKGEWEYDPKQPKYCYCQRPSFGEMVMCDNTFCELQWFHLQCIEEKKLPEKWFCRNCRGETANSFPQTKKNGRLK